MGRRAAQVGAVVCAMALAAAGCSGDDGSDASAPTTTATALPSCTEVHRAVATDIDATLTVSNEEFLMQAQDVTYDQMERPGAVDLLGRYSDLGYEIVYITARLETFSFPGTDADAREVTLDWLEAHGFPTEPGEARLYLAPDDVAVTGDPAPYKADVIEDLRDEGYEFDFAYGDSDTDFEAFLEAGVGEVFSVGEGAGFEGTTGILDEGYSDHIIEHVDELEPVCTRDHGPER